MSKKDEEIKETCTEDRDDQQLQNNNDENLKWIEEERQKLLNELQKEYNNGCN
jgi:hypothetical protein